MENAGKILNCSYRDQSEILYYLLYRVFNYFTSLNFKFELFSFLFYRQEVHFSIEKESASKLKNNYINIFLNKIMIFDLPKRIFIIKIYNIRENQLTI